MAFTVDQFRTNLVGDGARPNLFEVRLTTWPAYVTSPGPQTLSFLANSTSLPGSDIGITPLQYFGREVKSKLQKRIQMTGKRRKKEKR